MSAVSAILAAIVCFVLAALHIYWGLGHAWPARDQDELARTVVGTAVPGSMPGMGACSMVAVALFVAGLAPVFARGVEAAYSPPWLMTAAWLATLGAGIIFALRGLFGFVEHRVRPEIERLPYAVLNRRYYSPLCLLLSAAMFIAALG